MIHDRENLAPSPSATIVMAMSLLALFLAAFAIFEAGPAQARAAAPAVEVRGEGQRLSPADECRSTALMLHGSAEAQWM